MCEGPHVENTKEIDPRAFQIDKLAWAYWRGNSNNVMMTRIYVWAFEDKEHLKAYVEEVEEARRRDHRKLWKDLGIYMMSDLVGRWLPMYLPNGFILWNTLESYIREKEIKRGYLHVQTPPLGNVNLYKTSGHLEHYKDAMFPIMQVEDEEYVLRPMNCPHHMVIYSNEIHSYRNLPLRIAEIARDCRYEASGSLKGIERVRTFCQNDSHIFCTPEQIEDEFKNVVELILEVYKEMNIKDFKFELSLRDPEDKIKYHQDDEMWNKAEKALRKIMDDIGIPYEEKIGEAAFYGPKLDVQVKPAIGNEFTLSTCQIDFCLPAKFDLTYTDSDGNKKTPVVLHRAVFGSIDRTIAYYLEETKWVFPFWLAPEQVKIVPVADPFIDYANKVCEDLKRENIRASVDDSPDSLNKKIRNAELMKIPYILVVGEKEVNSNWVSVRVFKTKEQYEQSEAEFIKAAVEKRDTRALE